MSLHMVQHLFIAKLLFLTSIGRSRPVRIWWRMPDLGSRHEGGTHGTGRRSCWRPALSRI
eukprot:8741648-Pyramimonas_sp.AAC.1